MRLIQEIRVTEFESGSNPDNFSKRLEELKEDLISRNYKPKIIDEAFNKVKRISRKEALKKVDKSKSKIP